MNSLYKIMIHPKPDNTMGITFFVIAKDIQEATKIVCQKLYDYKVSRFGRVNHGRLNINLERQVNFIKSVEQIVFTGSIINYKDDNKYKDALQAMSEAFDIDQPASPTSAIGKCRRALDEG